MTEVFGTEENGYSKVQVDEYIRLYRAEYEENIDICNRLYARVQELEAYIMQQPAAPQAANMPAADIQNNIQRTEQEIRAYRQQKLAEIETESALVKDGAREQANLIVNEARKQADIAVREAEKQAGLIISESEKQAGIIVSESEKQAGVIMYGVQARAGQIMHWANQSQENPAQGTDQKYIEMSEPEQAQPTPAPAQTIAAQQEELDPDNITAKQRISALASGFLSNVIIVVCIVVIAASLLLHFDDRSNRAPRDIFGYSIMTVLTKSMQSAIPQDSFIVTKHVPVKEINIGDDITYMRTENTSVTHRVVSIYENFEGTGDRAFQTQGVENSAPDRDFVPAANVVGKVIFHNLIIGKVLTVFKKHGLILAILLVLIIAFIITMRKFFKAKPEKKIIIAGSTPEIVGTS